MTVRTKHLLQSAANRTSTRGPDVEQIEIVVAHGEGATLRVGDTTLKIDTDQERIDVEVAAMVMAPVAHPWRSCGGEGPAAGS